MGKFGSEPVDPAASDDSVDDDFEDDDDDEDLDFDDDHYDSFDDDRYDSDGDDYLIDGVGFADPGGTSALRAATESNPRNLPCPTCGEPNRLTPIDVARGYCCDSCVSSNE